MLAQAITPTMEKDPLIAARDAEDGAYLVVGQPLDVTEEHDLALARRELAESEFK
jgi:hypothetical protein